MTVSFYTYYIPQNVISFTFLADTNLLTKLRISSAWYSPIVLKVLSGPSHPWLYVELLAAPGSEDAESDDISHSRAETLPLCSRLQTTEPSSRLQRPIAVDDLWAYLAHQKTVGYRDLKSEYEVCVLLSFLYN